MNEPFFHCNNSEMVNLSFKYLLNILSSYHMLNNVTQASIINLVTDPHLPNPIT